MKSSIGKYFVGLDYTRALAAFIASTRHFFSANGDQNLPTEDFPLALAAFPSSLFSEGRTGISLLMYLGRYLFTKLLNNRKIFNYLTVKSV